MFGANLEQKGNKHLLGVFESLIVCFATELEFVLSTPERIEVYRQRYETYRHLDKLRWQMLQISVAIGPLILAFGAKEKGEPAWWVLIIVGILLLLFSSVMERIRGGINANAIVLKSAGEEIGDELVPGPSIWFRSTSFWVATVIRGLGLVALIWGVGKL